MDWPLFLDQHGIEYETAGKNTSRGHISISCIFCTDDPSKHLNISLAGKGWHCWRQQHPGSKSAARLVQALISCTWTEALRITDSQQSLPMDFLGAVQTAFANNTSDPINSTISLPDNFLPFKDLPSAKPFARYLASRAFPITNLKRYTRRYNLRYCTRGPFKGRIIFPVYHDNELVSWTGRTIFPNERLRYKALTTDPERAEREGLAPAKAPISHHLLWFDQLCKTHAHTLVLTEGPFDCLRVDMLGRQHGIRSTCFFTSAPTDTQIGHLRTLLPHFKRRVLLLDREALVASIQTTKRLASLGVTTLQMPANIDDPGDIKTTAQLLHLLA